MVKVGQPGERLREAATARGRGRTGREPELPVCVALHSNQTEQPSCLLNLKDPTQYKEQRPGGEGGSRKTPDSIQRTDTWKGGE